MKALFIAIVIIFVAISMSANATTTIDTSKHQIEGTKAQLGAFDEVIGEAKSDANIENMSFTSSNTSRSNSLEYIRRPKPLADDFSGYKIELLTVYNQPLAIDDDLFKAFGNVTFKHNTPTSTTYYIAEFKDEKSAEEFLEKVILKRYPNAQGVKFHNGEVVK